MKGEGSLKNVTRGEGSFKDVGNKAQEEKKSNKATLQKLDSLMMIKFDN